MPAQFSGKRLPNTAAAAFFARKLNLPSNEWSDLWREAHDKAFTVAGTLNDSGEKALAQIREAVRAAIEDGETIEEFKKRFDDIVAKTGWDYRGGRNFRARAIFETNLRTSWAAGRFAQMDEIKSERPFWQYRHGGSAQPRPEHLAWDGLILHADHPWWRTHYPPNGFGCTCHVVCLSAREVDREWKKAGGKGEAPKLSADSPGIAFGHDKNGKLVTPHVYGPDDLTVSVSVKGKGEVRVPRGIDPGWDYVPGKAALEAAKAQKAAQKAQEVKAEAKAEAKTEGAAETKAKAKTEAPQTAQKAAFKADSKAAQTPEKAPTKQLTPAQQKNIADLAATLADYEQRLDAARAKAEAAVDQSGDDEATRQKAKAALADAFASSIQAARDLHKQAKEATEAGKVVINIEIGFDNIVDELDARLSAILAKLKPAPKVESKPAPPKEPEASPEPKVEPPKPAKQATSKVSAEAKKKANAALRATRKGGRGSFEASAHMSAKYPSRVSPETWAKFQRDAALIENAFKGDTKDGGPTQREAREIAAYTTSEICDEWNDILRKAHNQQRQPQRASKVPKEIPQGLKEAAKGIERFSVPENIMVGRAVGGFGMLKTTFGDKFANEMNELFRQEKLEKIRDALNEKIKARQDRIYEAAFLSTTRRPDYRFLNRQIHLRIEVDKGTPGGALIENVSTFGTAEGEILFAPPSSLRMKKVYLTKTEDGLEVLVIYAKMAKNRAGKRKMERYDEQS